MLEVSNTCCYDDDQHEEQTFNHHKKVESWHTVTMKIEAVYAAWGSGIPAAQPLSHDLHRQFCDNYFL
ncbi:hypothetical protein LH86_01100 [Cedecea neteri]|nr:hypothetical protein LH86_01100 [Cedecea neteri]